MSVQDEMDRLDRMSRDRSLSTEQREAARRSWKKLNDDLILADWGIIENQGAELDALTAQLTAIVDDIQADRLTTAIDDINAFANAVRTRAQGGSNGGGG